MIEERSSQITVYKATITMRRGTIEYVRVAYFDRLPTLADLVKVIIKKLNKDQINLWQDVFINIIVEEMKLNINTTYYCQ